MKWTYAYGVDGAPVQVTRLNQERPQLYDGHDPDRDPAGSRQSRRP